MAASLLSCAKALEVADVPGAGRGVVTTRRVAAGEVLLSAIPYAVALDCASVDTVCLGCAKTSRKPLSLRCEVRQRLPSAGCAGVWRERTARPRRRRSAPALLRRAPSPPHARSPCAGALLGLLHCAP